MAHLYISAAHKSSGKTSVSVGLAGALTARGLAVQTFKKGPDYIDPLWLGCASGRACFNLDFFTMSQAEIRATFSTHSARNDISLIEGNKGLFDGVDLAGADCNAALAKLLFAPVLLVIDTGGMTRGIAPLIEGYLNFDTETDIRGVVLNMVGGARHEDKLRAALERYTDIEVVGAIGRDPALEIPERHLGLTPTNECDDPGPTIERLTRAVVAGVDIDRVVEIAGLGNTDKVAAARPSPAAATVTGKGPELRIAIARDAAFHFYYQDDLDAFARAGAKLVPFDTLHDTRLPDVDGIFIGGGFPEVHLQALAANVSLLADIRQALAAGMPGYAECGGLMYLTKSISWQDKTAGMVGTIPGDIVVDGQPHGRGYMLLNETGDGLWPAADVPADRVDNRLPAHEFHYARIELHTDSAKYAYQVLRGHGIDGQHDGLIVGNLLAGFAHLRDTSANPWVSRFVAFVRSMQRLHGINLRSETSQLRL